MPDGTLGIKFLHDDNFKTNVQIGEMDRNVTEMLSEYKYVPHFYENNQTRSIKIMTKKLHYSCKCDSIVDDLVRRGYNALDGVNKLKSKTKEPLDIFMVTFSIDEDIKKIHEISNTLVCKVD